MEDFIKHLVSSGIKILECIALAATNHLNIQALIPQFSTVQTETVTISMYLETSWDKRSQNNKRLNSLKIPNKSLQPTGNSPVLLANARGRSADLYRCVDK